MASAGPQLVQGSTVIEGRLKTLLNNDLKNICKAYGHPVSGNKVQLQQRCIAILRDLVHKGDQAGINNFSTRVSNHGVLPTPTTTHYNTNTTPSMLNRPPLPPPTSRLEFRNSPFYERVEVVLRASDMPEMPQNRHTVKSNLVLTEDQARRLTSSQGEYRLMVYCASPSPNIYSAVDVAFPSQIEIKVNDDDVKANFRGLKNKPGSTKPADITHLVRAKAGYTNKLTVCYALTNKRFTYVVYLVRYITPETLVQKIGTNRVFPKAKVLDEYARRNADPDIAATLTKMSLKDPVSTLRITVPVRSTICSHNQCFDASFFLQLQEQAPTWQCPICSRTVSFESLSIDKYFEEILQNTPQSVEQVTVEPNGEWQAVQEEEDTNTRNKKPKAAYDHDSDDEVIELDASPVPIKKEPSNINLSTINTPPVSTRAPSIVQNGGLPSSSRPKAVTIDLTLSDDDEPVRAPKRPRLDGPPARASPMLPSPSSIYAGRPQAHGNSLAPLSTRTDYGSPSTNGALQSPLSLSPFTTTAAPAAAFGRPEPSTRPSTHLGTSSTNLLSQWSTFRSPPLMSNGIDPQRRLSMTARLGEADATGMLNWHANVPPMISPTLPGPSQAVNDTSTYTGFADGPFPGRQTSRDGYGMMGLPNGYPGNSASPT